jgi:hypothetical protein
VEAGDFYGHRWPWARPTWSLWEMVGAYRALGAGGVWSPLRMTTGRARPGESPSRLLGASRLPGLEHPLRPREPRCPPSAWEEPARPRASGRGEDGDEQGDARQLGGGLLAPLHGEACGSATSRASPLRNVSGGDGGRSVWLESWRAFTRRLQRGAAASPGLARREVAFTGAVEPARRGWFSEGTEPAPPDLATLAAPARILAPVAGTSSPSTPTFPRRQRVRSRRRDARPGERAGAARRARDPRRRGRLHVSGRHAPGRHQAGAWWRGTGPHPSHTVIFVVRGMSGAGDRRLSRRAPDAPGACLTGHSGSFILHRTFVHATGLRRRRPGQSRP